MPKKWRISRCDPAAASRLGRDAGVPAIVAQLLLARGVADPELARNFLSPKLTGLRDPGELPGVSEAARLLHQAIRNGERITVYGDYDADGMTATAILLRCLKLLGADVDFYVPHRLDEGYGLNADALRALAERGASVVVTVDCGIASVAEAEVAAELGLRLVVTDHHQFAPTLPPAAVLVHPALPGTDYPFHGLCGAAVAFKLAWALCQEAAGERRVGESMRAFLLQAVGLAAIGTVADVVPLVDENRILVRYGLEALRSDPTAGVSALMKLTGLDKKRALGGEDLGFTIGPRLNAAGRLGQAEIGVELLTTDSAERAEQLSRYVDELNGQRQSVERSIYRGAVKQAQELFEPTEDPALVLCDHEWHAGVIGIVAGRLAERFHRPTILIADDPLGAKPGIGSARSVPGFDLHAALAECGDHLESHGGHAAAAGLRIHRRNLDAFRKHFFGVAATRMNGQDLQAELDVDAEASLAMLTRQTVEQIESLAPFGQGNSRPLLCTSEVKLVGPPRKMGSNGRHLSMTVDQHGVQMRAVAFGAAEWEEDLVRADGPLSIAFRPVINHFRGRSSVELHLDDWRRE